MATQVIKKSPVGRSIELKGASSKLRNRVFAVVGALTLAVVLGVVVVQASTEAPGLSAGRIADGLRYQAQADTIHNNLLRGWDATAARYQAQADSITGLTRGRTADALRYQAQADAAID